MFETLHPYQVSFFLVGATGPVQEERPKNQFTNFFAAHFFHSKKPCPTPPSNPSFPLPLSTGGPSHKHPPDPPPPLPDPAFLFQALLLLTPQQAASPTMVLPSLPTKYPILPNWHGMTRGLSTSNSTPPLPQPLPPVSLIPVLVGRRPLCSWFLSTVHVYAGHPCCQV